MSLTKKKIEFLSEKEVLEDCSEFPDGNDYICETAGFIPLEIKFKRFEQAGQIARLNASDFTSQDYRDMYSTPDYDIYPDDDLDDIEIKMQGLQDHIQNIKNKVYEREMQKQVQIKKQEEIKNNSSNEVKEE